MTDVVRVAHSPHEGTSGEMAMVERVDAWEDLGGGNVNPRLARTPSQDPMLHELDTIAAAFATFHVKHPEVYVLLVEMARKAKARRDHIGIGMLFEVLRWEWIISGLPADDARWKLNNNFRSHYARKIMAENPELAGLFRLRKLRSE
jgi:hypothetical protein